MSVSSILSAIASEFDGDAARDTFISLASNRVNYTFFGANAEFAHALMTAHMMTMRDLSKKTGGFAIGALTGMKEGDVSLSMKASGSSNESDLGATSYGMQFLNLQKSANLGIALTGVGSFLTPEIS